MAIKITKKIDPKKTVKAVQKSNSGEYAQGSEKLNNTISEGRSRAAAAQKSGDDMKYISTRVSSQSGGSNLGDKTTKLLGRADKFIPAKVRVTKKRK